MPKSPGARPEGPWLLCRERPCKTWEALQSLRGCWAAEGPRGPSAPTFLCCRQGPFVSPGSCAGLLVSSRGWGVCVGAVVLLCLLVMWQVWHGEGGRRWAGGAGLTGVCCASHPC